MIFSALLMLVQAAAVPDALPLGVLPAQSMPRAGCAAFLFTRGAPRLFLAVAGADPAQLRVSLDGVVIDLPRTAQNGAGGFGLAGVTGYAAGGVTAVLDMTIVARADLKDGAAVTEATLRIDRAGQDGVVVPVAGIVACAP